MNDALENLLQNPRIWRGNRQACMQDGLAAGYPTGYARLDRQLPGGGWPQCALTEILLERYGSGELQLLMPALARLSHGDPHGDPHGDSVETGVAAGWIAWIAPPFQPYPPALLQWGVDLAHILIVHTRQGHPSGRDTEALWAAEQALSSGNCAAVLVWPGVLDNKASRRLQLAAEKGRSWAIAFRPLAAASQFSAAALRMALVPGEQGSDVRILKSRGGRPVTVPGIFRPTGNHARRYGE